MISRILIILLASWGSLSAAGFDDFDIRGYYPLKPECDGESYAMDRTSYKTIFLHSNPYGMGTLNWNQFAARYNRPRWGVEFTFAAFGFEEYYQRNRYDLSAKYNFYGGLYVVETIEIRREDFGSFGAYTGSSMDLFINYIRPKYSAGFGLAEISLSELYDAPGYEKSQPFAAGSAIIGKGLELTAGVRRFENGRVRWLSRIEITRNAGLNFGYQNKPSNIRSGLIFTVNRFSFLITYNSIGGLDDSVIWGISFGE
jgi:hypothetical protein